jgi:DNA mismatch repair ATPase MutL
VYLVRVSIASMSSFFRRRQGNTPNNNGRSTESSDRTSDSNNTNDTRSSSLSSSSQARRSRNDRSKETRKSQGSTTFRVRIPQTVRPGEMFQVYAGTRLVKLKCPPNATPGQSLAIKVPKEEENSADARNRQNKLHGPNVDPIPNTNPPAFMVTIPPHVRGGQQFPVKINGVDLMVTSPHNALPGMSVRIVPPKTKRRIRAPENNKGQLFEVQVPKGVQPGKSFALLANGIRISVTCPLNASPGQSVRFHLPFRTTSDDGPASNFVVKTLNYDLDGWVRTLQVSIMKFQWIRVRKNSNDMDKDNIAQDSVKKQISQLAYVTQISTTDGLECVSAQHGMVDIFVLSPQTGKVIATCTDLVAIQSQNFSDKLTSFYDLCGKVGNHGKNAHKICIQVRRDFLLEDSLEAVMSLNGIELKNIWRFHFMGEEGVDAGGLKREWFQLISSMLLDPESGLWMNCGGNQMNLQINPNSGEINRC